MSITRRIIALCMLLILLPGLSYAQSRAPAGVGLFADRIDYDPTSNTLTASGNVKLLYNDQTLTADRLIYNQDTGMITIPSAFQLTGADGTVIVGSSANLKSSSSVGLITDAKILINDQFQMSASEFIRTQERFKTMRNVVASTCYICSEDDIPFWQISAKQIVHDELNKRFYFEDPTLRIAGLPVLYLPYLSTPDLTVKRATGFLVPEFRQSSTLGYRIELPYYIAIDDHSDATITPTLSSKESLLIQTEYRKNFQNGSIYVDAGFTVKDPLSERDLRSYVFSKGQFNLESDYQLKYQLDLASDKKFKDQYRLTDQDRLRNFITVEKTTDHSHFSVGASFTQSLRKNEIDQEIPLVFPELYYRNTKGRGNRLGQFGYTLQSASLVRTDGSKFARIGGGIDFQRTKQFQNGMILTSIAKLDANAYFLSNYDGSSTLENASILPTGAFKVSYPLSKTNGSAIHVIEPIAQVVWSPNKIALTPNEDSPQAEFEESNLFSINRFQGFDRAEQGLRANIGVQYLRYDPSGWELGVTVGRVFRQKNLDQFPKSVSEGLEGVSSDYVGAVSLRFPDQFHLASRVLFDADGNFSKNETQFGFTHKKLDVAATYVWLDSDTVLSNNEKQNEITLDAFYRANQRWSSSANWRYDLAAKETIQGDFGIQYENECATVGFSLSLRNEGLAKLTREFGLKVALEGIGTRKSKHSLKRKCGI